MTQQISSTCMFDGRTWKVDDENDLGVYVPSSDTLGFSTVMESTANWSGRIDHFLIHNQQLHLFKIEVNLPKNARNLCPPGVRRERTILYEPVTIYRDGSTESSERVHEYIYFIYDDIQIEYSGELVLLYPSGNAWELPWPIEDEDIEPTLLARLQFRQGTLADVEYEDPQ